MDEIDDFVLWLQAKIDDSKESYQRDTNSRHTAISLGKVRAYRHVRDEYLGRTAETATDQQEDDTNA